MIAIAVLVLVAQFDFVPTKSSTYRIRVSQEMLDRLPVGQPDDEYCKITLPGLTAPDTLRGRRIPQWIPMEPR